MSTLETQFVSAHRHYTGREMTGHFRAQEEGTPLDKFFKAHVETCEQCKPDWELVQTSDPILRQFYPVEPVGLVIERVQANEANGAGDTGFHPLRAIAKGFQRLLHRFGGSNPT